jgi:prepilin-type N-terminal cleavage/methylation domain-containing protein
MQTECSSRRRASAAVTLLELLCVMTIIGILVALLLPAVFGAYNRVRGFAQEWDADEVAMMLEKETRNYCAAHLQYAFGSKDDLATKCVLAPKCRDWLRAPSTDFVPFTYLDPTNMIVLSVHLGPKQATLYQFTKGDLSIRPGS